MSFDPNGEMIPVGGGDNIPLIKPVLSLGRRPSCDIQLNFSNISGLHCELTFNDGIWIIRDLNSTNGVKVNGNRVAKKVLHPGDTISIGKRDYTIEYTLSRGRQALAELLEETEELSAIPLLEKAGLARSQQSIDRLLGKSQDKSVDKLLPRSIDRPMPKSVDKPLPRIVPKKKAIQEDEEEDD
jgi:pSer/pThr/pTyr-binding forkhead associated (FHA) protein